MVSLAHSGPGNPERLEWPAAQRPELREFLTAILRDGATCYARNVQEEFALIQLDDCVLPLVVNHGDSSSCYLTSPLCHYADYPYQIILGGENMPGKRSILASLRA